MRNLDNMDFISRITNSKFAFIPNLLKKFLLWIGLGTLVWAVAILGELAKNTKSETLVLAPHIADVIKTGFLFSLAGAAVLTCLHMAFVMVRERSNIWKICSSVGLALLIAPFAWDQADFLTSGDAIAEHKWVAAIKAGLFVVCDLALLSLFVWHLFLSSRFEKARDSIRQGVGWLHWLFLVVPGLCVSMSLYYLVIFQLDTYVYFARFLLIPLWVAAVTVVACAALSVRRVLWIIVPLIMVSLVLTAVVKPDLDQRISLMRDSRMIVFTSHLMDLNTPNNTIQLNLSNPERFTCSEIENRLPKGELPGTPETRKNVILISIDTVRRDAFSWEVKGKPLMPRLKEFSRQSLFFSNAETTYPSTTFSVGGVVTGLEPSQILLSPKLSKNVFSLTENTFDKQFVVFPNNKYFRMPLIKRLYVQTAKHYKYKNAEKQNKEFIYQMRKARQEDKRTFAWIHYYEPHRSYKKHDGFDFGNSDKEKYMSELAYIDSKFGQLVDYLEEDGWMENSLIIVFSDHGESLGERNFLGHNVYLYPWITEIILMARAPGLAPGVEDKLTALNDIAPTVLHFAGESIPSHWPSHSLLSLPDEERFVVSEVFPVRGKRAFKLATKQPKNLEELGERIDYVQHRTKKYEPKVSIVNADYRLLVRRETGVIQLYDKKNDPLLENDLSAERPQARDKMLEQLRIWHEKQSQWIYCRLKKSKRKR